MKLSLPSAWQLKALLEEWRDRPAESSAFFGVSTKNSQGKRIYLQLQQ